MTGHRCEFHFLHSRKVWLAECQCGAGWHSDRYTEVERSWAEHVRDHTGTMPRLSEVDL